jgi:hypothetical protein
MCIDNAADTSSTAMPRTFHCRMSQERPPRGLYNHHTRSHCIDDPQTGDGIYKKTISDSTI